MTRKDYIAIAHALHAAGRHAYKHADTRGKSWAAFHFAHAREFLADALALDNPRFDRERFLKACREGC